MMEPNAAPPATDAGSPSSTAGSVGAATVPLTLKQQAVYDMKVAGKTRKEIAHILGISEPVVSKTLGACYRKLGLRRKDRLNLTLRGQEHSNPEVVAAVLDAGTEPLQKLKDAFKAAGLPVPASEALLKRIRHKYFGVTHAVKALKTNEIVGMIEEKLDIIRFYLDDKVMAEASARDLMLGAGVLIEKRNLLRGEPTQILSDKERKTIHELMPELLAEAKRRGLTVDGQVTGKTSEPA